VIAVALFVAAIAVACPDTMAAEPTAPNYCTTLSPTPDLDSVTGILELADADSPYGVAVTPDGRPRYTLTTRIAGLPAPSTFGRAYTVYIAWATSLTMDSIVKLGVVHNGRTTLGDIARNQFRVIVSAERSGAVSSRTGRLVLRGTSPSTRLLAHRDLATPFAPGAQTTDMLMDDARLFRPGGAVDSTAVLAARPTDTLRLRSGDTVTLTATPVRRVIAGRSVVLYGYNGEVPGPLLQVSQGASLVVRFRNAIDLPTAVHWHGVRVDNRFDGAVGLTQDAVPPGGTFYYTVHFPDAGVYWYHAHDREDVEQASGLYGNILVTPRSPTYYAPANQTDVLAIEDMLLDQAGAARFGASAPTHALMGRFGNTFLVNGRTGYERSTRRGSVVRFFLTNVSNARTYNLSFTGARMKLVASDMGRFEHEAWVRSIVIGPAERYVVDVRFPTPGVSLLLNRIQALDHPSGTIYPEVDTLGRIDVRPDPASPDYATSFARLRIDSTLAREIAHDRAELGRAVDRPPDYVLLLEMQPRHLPAAITTMMTGVSTPVDWNDGMGLMNRAATGDELTWVLRDGATGAENMAIHWHVRQGRLVTLRVYNVPTGLHPMDHPLHVHGQRVLVMRRNGAANQHLVWKDTVIIPAGQVVDLLVEMTNPGRWMLHCHIAEHRTSGMMLAFDVDSLSGGRP
jgi:suppressor of ftsI